MSINSEPVAAFLMNLQDRLCEFVLGFEAPGARFREDHWQRPADVGGGGGRTRVYAGGETFEQAGIGYSDVSGSHLPPSATQARPELAGCGFRAMGVSLVFHPRNPHVPTTHMNVRLFQATGGTEPIWWFGGGFDLTPFYAQLEDVRHWHRTAKAVCDRFDPNYYSAHKAWCDRYFYLKHRDECRGVGGLFFDDLHTPNFEQCFGYLQAVGNGFMDAYRPLVEARRSQTYGERERQFQLYRRGRYVEFNLVWDRGTLFGLQSGGRTESILMSLPPAVRFEYGYQPDAGSAEARLLDFLRPRDWLHETA